MASNKAMVVAAVLIVAFAVVKANQCSSDGEGTGGNKPNNAVSMLQTKLQKSAPNDEDAAPALGGGVTPAVVDQALCGSGELMSDTAEAADLAADEALLKHVIEQWSVRFPSADRSPSSFMQRHQCQEEPLLTTTFQSLDAKTGGNLSFDDIPSLLEQNKAVVKFSIRDQQVVFDPNCDKGCDKQNRARGDMQHAILKHLLNEVDLPDMDLMVSVLDGSPTETDQVGIMRTEGCAGKDLLVIPRSLLGLHMRKKQPVCSQHYPQAVFRGASNGLLRNDTTLRYFAASLSKSRPELVDAGYTFAGRDSPFSCDHLQSEGLMKNKLSYQEQQCYSTALVIDGYSVPDRLAQQLLWGLPTVFMHDVLDEKNHCTIDEFWYHELKPDKDFIQASPDNLETVLENLLENPEHGTRIGQSGKKFVQQQLSMNRMKCYLFQLLSEYGRRYVVK